jgi:acetyl esterase/lipase
MRESVNPISNLPNYGKVYSTFATDGCESTWLTLLNQRKTSDPIILYIHGGCFAIQMKDVCVEFFSNLYRVMYRDHEKPVSILIADYSLTTANFAFPQQFKEIGYLYNKLVEEGNTNIVVIGDSAGGNLSLNLLQHLYQKPDPVWPSAIIPISPWLDVTNVEYSGSFKAHAKLDVFSYEAVDYYGKQYTQYSTEYNDNPIVNINSSTIDWNNIPVFNNGNCLLVFGENEVLTDQIFKFLENSRYHERFPDRVVLDPKGVHIGLFLSETVGYNNDLDIWKKGFCINKIVQFLVEVA